MKKAAKKTKTAKKRKKNTVSDGLHAFILVGLIVIFAIAISLTIISVHSSLNKKPVLVISELIDGGETNTLTEYELIDISRN